MQNVSTTTSCFAQRTFLDRMLGRAQRAWTAYWQRRAESATVTILNSLDDRALKDIGMDRSEIESVVYGPREDRRDGEWHQAEWRIGICA